MDDERFENSKLLVVAIDFGTTFSGYAFAFNDGKRNINMNKNWGDEVGCQSYKAPTCVLTGREGEFKAFGYEAEKEFANAKSSEVSRETKDCLQLYRHFKMVLHREVEDRKTIRTCAIPSTTGKRTPAVDIFAMTLRYFKSHLLSAINTKMAGKLEDYFIKWLVTVPAIWSDEAKHLMREASKKAGLIEDVASPQLIIALEPEAASLYCREEVGELPNSSAPLKEDDKYLIIDCGGGTADITAHKVTPYNTLREIYAPCGGPWGGTNVNEKFKNLLENVFGKNVMAKFKEKHSQDWLKMNIDFEMHKKVVKSDSEKDLNVPVPYSLGMLVFEVEGKTLEDFVRAKSSLGVEWNNGSVCIKANTAKGLFHDAISSLTARLRKIMQHEQLSQLNYAFLVGGFSQCELLQKEIQEVFARHPQCRVIIPFEGQLAIVKGAVLFGFHPSRICSRIAQATYGFETSKEFNVKEHDSKYVAEMAGKQWCSGLFSVVISKGEILDIGTIKRHKLRTNNESKAHGFTGIDLYRSHDQDVKYVTGSKKIAQLQIEHEFELFQHNTIYIEIHCGSTEILFKAKDNRKDQWCQTTVTYN